MKIKSEPKEFKIYHLNYNSTRELKDISEQVSFYRNKNANNDKAPIVNIFTDALLKKYHKVTR